MPACLARGLNTLFQKGHGACNQYLVASWLPCSAPWAWSLSSIRVIQKIPSDLGFWDQPPYVELFLFLVQNLAGWDGGTEPLKNLRTIFVGVCLEGVLLIGFFFIPTIFRFKSKGDWFPFWEWIRRDLLWMHKESSLVAGGAEGKHKPLLWS